MLRLAFTFILLLLMLFGGAVWLLDMQPGSPETEQQAAKPAENKEKPHETAKSLADDLQDALKPSTTPEDGSAAFDVARIDPKGTSVFAGRGEAGSLVTITVDGKEVGTAKVDENGDWTLTTDARIENPDGKLALFKAPPGSVPRVVGAEPQVAKATPPAPSPDKPKTAQAVTSSMLKSLEGMVAAARTEEKAATPATAPSSPQPPPAMATSPAPQPPPTAAAPVAEPALAAAPSSSPPVSSPAPGANAASTTTVPVPVTFVYNEATLTTDGRKAAALLLEYLQLKRFPRITLTGHADERGSEELNLVLSRERLDTVARFLREGGYAGQLELVPKGKGEPYKGVVRGDFSQEDLWQLDRRVELVVLR